MKLSPGYKNLPVTSCSLKPSSTVSFFFSFDNYKNITNIKKIKVNFNFYFCFKINKKNLNNFSFSQSLVEPVSFRDPGRVIRNSSVQVNKSVLLGQSTSMKNPSGFSNDVRIGSKMCNCHSGKFHRFAVFEERS